MERQFLFDRLSDGNERSSRVAPVVAEADATTADAMDQSLAESGNLPGGASLLHYYKQELAYLHSRGAVFAAGYPKIASRLAWHAGESHDPHVERLIEATAFLAARVHRELDQSVPQIATAVLDNVCPTLTQPVPPMTVVSLSLDQTQGKATSGFAVPRHSAMLARTAQGELCHFRTAWAAELWPLRVVDVVLTQGESLRLVLEADVGVELNELSLRSLRLHLQGPWMTTVPLYELLVTAVTGVCGAGEGPDAASAGFALPASAWREAGYGPEEDVLPQSVNGLPQHALLQEYFAFPRKFHFFDVQLPHGLPFKGRRCTLTLHLDRHSRPMGAIDARSILLGCVPAVNVHERTSEPVAIDGSRYEYRLVADHRRDAVTEVHSVLSVMLSDPMAGSATPVTAWSTLDTEIDRGAAAQRPLFWSVRRESRPGAAGTDMFLTVAGDLPEVDGPSTPVAYAQLLCLEPGLAEQVGVGTPFVFERATHPVLAECLYEPTSARMPVIGEAAPWRLVSALTLNPQVLMDPVSGSRRVRELLSLFASDRRRDRMLIQGIKLVRGRAVVGHVGTPSWRGLCQGTEITLELDPEAFVGASPLLLAAVLARFFSLHASINTFVELVLRHRDELWKRWGPLIGHQTLI